MLLSLTDWLTDYAVVVFSFLIDFYFRHYYHQQPPSPQQLQTILYSKTVLSSLICCKNVYKISLIRKDKNRKEMWKMDMKKLVDV